ncbi:signal peptidase II [Limosilactobacillus caecicola]|uniref:signal peptidase II n=1 Tax=Limosilactobacillus caecicola TaxID=2941332 RepID=UPI00203A8A58|nr:signal peptidase II [Limosilactobacillus caecicola]
MKHRTGWVYNLILIVVLVACDQLVKQWVSNHISHNGFRTLVPGLLGLTNLENDGAAWSLLEGKQWFFAIVTVIAIVVLIYLMHRFAGHGWVELALSFIFAGTIGNFLDRLRFGYVIDMFELLPINFPVFNVADVCLTVGVIVLILIVLLEKDEDEHGTQSTN